MIPGLGVVRAGRGIEDAIEEGELATLLRKAAELLHVYPVPPATVPSTLSPGIGKLTSSPSIVTHCPSPLILARKMGGRSSHDACCVSPCSVPTSVLGD
jgi:hypothetical protein